MPRAKFVPSKYTLLYRQIGYFKVEYPDFIHDFMMIYEDIINYLSQTGNEHLPIYAEIKAKKELMKKAHIKPEMDNRFYIVTNYDQPVLAVVNMDESVIDNLIETYNFLSWINEDCPDRIFGSYLCTLYVFKGNNMCLNTSISPYKLAQFMAAFKAENLVNYQGVRDSLYAAPRRRRRQSQ